ncbi:beta/alpha barrel domain-containing protein [Mucilaginibacter ginsenosidivorans]|uniref:Bifunctional 4-hydroxy-2-oxoglutarate aldolase/2-dehydro-3-deoxy-phosphogluconate aldolase n=1 Tax=Mucilaginibacter ginsenosidivorans TaxID=398053 RepID=A0A5B8UU34_9SPHI|nr:bifunctional 4-hydroxy-2-oxoglutarate aldolase/2-dehydro-3-deoxy-phosphogluconate aldolase [Mucilaginibacter ginsenosidivorans]QEC61871.1 bifunctional 4-hydroxy-2-oxoglutarate aldolase/2-dehydro-3-deoxy-phosphogluconate aldolase [Mucilaginibacter ginsenosidivorans]
MKNKQAVLGSIIKQGMLPLFFYEDGEVSLQIVRTLYKAGVRVMEYTNRAKEAFENFKMLKAAVDKEMPDFYFGIGTIKTKADAIKYIEAGADFIVAPTINPEVGEVANRHGGLWIPGCMTPTEIHLAQEHGAALIKIFPANVLGPGFVSAVTDVFRGQLFMPTGGVELNKENISGWFKAGVCAVGMGSKLITRQILQNKLYDQLYADTVTALALVQSSRQL